MLVRIAAVLSICLGLASLGTDASSEPVGPEFQVNTSTVGKRAGPVVAPLKGGGFVVIWTALTQDRGMGGIYGQRFGSDGQRAGTEFRVNTYRIDDQRWPSVAALEDGGFVVAWQSYKQDGSGSGVYAQRYTGRGRRAGGEIRVNTKTRGDQTSISIASLNENGFVVIWESRDNEGRGIFGQRFAIDGTPVGREMRINKTKSKDQINPLVVGNGGGRFTVIWSSDGQDGSSYGVFAQRFDANGRRVGDEFQVNSTTDRSQLLNSVAGLIDGSFVVTWVDDFVGIRAQRFDADGAALGNELIIEEYAEYTLTAALSDDGFVAVFYSNVVDWYSFHFLYGQRYTATGGKVGENFEVDDEVGPNYVTSPAVAGLNDGGFVVVWDRNGTMYGRRYSP